MPQNRVRSVANSNTSFLSSNILNLREKATQSGRALAVLHRTLISGQCTFERVFKAVQAKYEPFFIPDFKRGFLRELEGGLK